MPTIPTPAGNWFDVPVFNAKLPKEGPRGLPLTVPFDQGTDWDMDLTLTQQLKFMETGPQAVLCDNSANSAPVTITSDLLSWPLIIPPASQAQLPMVTAKAAKIHFHSEGGVPVRVVLLNVPVAAAVWPVAGAGGAEGVEAPAGMTTPLGAAGTKGDYLSALVVTPGDLNPGAIQIKDGALAAVTVFTGGAGSVGSLVPFTIPLGLVSKSGGWSIISGAGTQSVLAAGQFT